MQMEKLALYPESLSHILRSLILNEDKSASVAIFVELWDWICKTAMQQASRANGDSPGNKEDLSDAYLQHGPAFHSRQTERLFGIVFPNIWIPLILKIEYNHVIFPALAIALTTEIYLSFICFCAMPHSFIYQLLVEI